MQMNFHAETDNSWYWNTILWVNELLGLKIQKGCDWFISLLDRFIKKNQLWELFVHQLDYTGPTIERFDCVHLLPLLYSTAFIPFHQIQDIL